MKSSIIILLSFATFSASAQELSWFSVDDADYFEASKCRPGSFASFYKSPQGGKLLSTEVVPASGISIVKGTAGYQPKMVLNSGKEGTHRVAFLGSREFAFKGFKALHGDGKALISWNASIDPESKVSFDVIRTVKGTPSQIVAHIDGNAGGLEQPYSWSEDLVMYGATYQVRVLNGTKGQRHLTDPITLGQSDLEIFPSIVTKSCTIKTNSGIGEYYLVSQDGRQLSTGKLSGVHTIVSLEAVPPGNYVLKVHHDGQLEKTKITRL